MELLSLLIRRGSRNSIPIKYYLTCTGLSLPIRNHYVNQSKSFFSLSRMASQEQEPSQTGVNQVPTAGIIIIGDEILKGQTLDTNSHFLAKQLHSLGVKVERISVIPDDIHTIAKEVNQFSETYTFVLTSGGIGPTHDDITFEAVAAAFGEKVHPHPTLVSFLKTYFKTDDLSSAPMKMAHIPESSVLNFGEDKEKGIVSRYPIISVRNVTIFPGIPHLLEKAFGMLGKKLFHKPGTGFHVEAIYLTADEVTIASKLNSTVKNFPSVNIGSYPKLFHSYYKTKITMDSLKAEDIAQASLHFRNQLQEGMVIDYNEDTITSPWEFVNKLMESSVTLKKQIEEALQVISDCFTKYKPEEVCVCYNGGKDCLAVLHLVYAVMNMQHHNSKLQALYITEPNAFPQVTEFVNHSINRYNLDCEVLPGPMKTALTCLLEKRPNLKAMIMGTRRTDPYSDNLQFFSPTDKDWPSMMRVNPIINWEYNEVWNFIRGLYIPYCPLYDRGYTSLGNQNNTLPNPLLETKDPLGQVMYLPAYKLTQHDLERKGRISSKQ